MNDLTCAEGVDLLMDYLDGALSAADRADVDAHVSGCDRCRAFIASYQATPRVVRDATAVEMPQDLQDSLMHVLRERRAGRPEK